MKYIVKILPGQDCNPEFAPDKSLQEGVECNGIFMLTFKEENKIHFGCVQDVSVDDLRNAIWKNCDEEVINMLRMSVAIAEGYIRADDIGKKRKEHERFIHFKEMLGGMSWIENDEEDDQEDEE